MAKPKLIEKPLPDPATMAVTSNDEYARRGWLFYSKNEYQKAADDFRHVLESEPAAIDSWYGLGLTLKGAGDSSQASLAFSKILGLLDTITDQQRAHVLSRLVKGHLNMIKSGDWDLEKEVWKRA